MSKIKSVDFVKKYTMIIVLIIVTAFFAWRTGGAILLPMNVSSLISQNAYVFILATGMLLCILTGGNIDLSVGSVVCFVGAIGAMLMVNMKMNMWLAILIMFVVGTLIGAFQGFWIAYVRIPPFIVTLAGMLAFRGLSNVVLDGMTVSIKDCTTFVNLFGGGADCYIPDFFGNGSLNMTCIFAGVLAAAIYISIQIKGRMDKVKKGYEVEGGFYALLLSSKLPVAKKFKHWVTGDVLPKIRKDGFYAMKLDLELQKKLIGEQDIEIRRLNGVLDEQTRWASIQGENVINLEKQVDGLLPKAIYSDNVLDSVSCFTTTQVAKELGITAQELNRSLCALHIQYYQSGQYMLYAEYAHMGLAKSRTRYNAFLDPKCDGRQAKMGKAVTHTYLVWTEKGRKFIHDLAHRFWELAEMYEVMNLG